MNKLIIVEGPQGVGKSTVTNYIRDKLPYTNLLRLAGLPDNSIEGLPKVIKYYKQLFKYLDKMSNTGINFVLDRFFITEQVYSELGFKQYDFTKYFMKFLDKLTLLDYEIHYINLYLSDTNNYDERLKRIDKGVTSYANYSFLSSIKQQDKYEELSKIILNGYWPWIEVNSVATDIGDLSQVLQEIDYILKI